MQIHIVNTYMSMHLPNQVPPSVLKGLRKPLRKNSRIAPSMACLWSRYGRRQGESQVVLLGYVFHNTWPARVTAPTNGFCSTIPVVSNIFLNFTPTCSWGRWTHFDWLIFFRWVLQPPRLIFPSQSTYSEAFIGAFWSDQAKNCIYLKRSMAGGHVTGTGETHWQPDLSEMKWTNQQDETLQFSVFVVSTYIHLMSFPGWDPQGIWRIVPRLWMTWWFARLCWPWKSRFLQGNHADVARPGKVQKVCEGCGLCVTHPCPKGS